MGDSPAETPVVLVVVIIETLLAAIWLVLYIRRWDTFPIRGRLPKLVAVTSCSFILYSWLAVYQLLWLDVCPCLLILLYVHTIWFLAINPLLLRIWVLHFAYNATEAMTTFSSQSSNLRKLNSDNWYLKNKHRISGTYLARVVAVLMFCQLITPAVSLALFPQIVSSMGTGDCPLTVSNLGVSLFTAFFAILVYSFAQRVKKFHDDGFQIRTELTYIGYVAASTVPLWLVLKFAPVIGAWDEAHFGFSTLVVTTGAFGVNCVSLLYPLILSYRSEATASVIPLESVEDMRSLDRFLTSPSGVADFQQFLSTEFSVENLFFYLEIDAFRNAYKAPEKSNTTQLGYPSIYDSPTPVPNSARGSSSLEWQLPISAEDIPLTATYAGTVSHLPQHPRSSSSPRGSSQPDSRSGSFSQLSQAFQVYMHVGSPGGKRPADKPFSLVAKEMYSSDLAIEEAARSIYYRYVREFAPMQINLPSKIRHSLRFLDIANVPEEPESQFEPSQSVAPDPYGETMGIVHPNMFDKAQRSILRLMETDTWIRYMRSESYQKWLADLQEKANTARLIMAVEH